VKAEEDPLDPDPPASFRPAAVAIRHLEDAVAGAGGAVLRYGAFYGPGATDDQRVLRLLPITRSEARFTGEHGLEALERRFDESEMEYWRGDRPPVA